MCIISISYFNLFPLDSLHYHAMNSFLCYTWSQGHYELLLSFCICTSVIGIVQELTFLKLPSQMERNYTEMIFCLT